MKYIILCSLFVTGILGGSNASAQLNYTFGRAITGHPNSTGDVIAIQPGRNGNMYVLGNFMRSIELGAGSSHTINAIKPSVYLVKYDKAGNYIFSIALQGRAISGLSATAMTLDSLDNIYISGYFDSSVDFNPDPSDSAILYSAGPGNIFFAKYDSSGNYRYAKAIEGMSQNFAWDIKTDHHGNVLLAGQFFGTADFDPSTAVVRYAAKGGQNAFLAKYDTAGNYIFAKVLTGTANNQANQIAIDRKDNVYIVGTFYKTLDADPGPGTKTLTSADAGDVFFAKYDALGRYLFARSLEGPDSQLGQAIALDRDNNCYISGSFFSRIDADPSAAAVTYVSAGSCDVFFARYDTSGNYIMSQAISGKGFNQPSSILVDEYRHIYIAGRSADSIDFDPAPLTTAIADGQLVFVAAYDSLGQYQYAQTTTGRNSQVYCANLQYDQDNNFYLAGVFDTTVQLDFSGVSPELINTGARAGFIARYHQCLLPKAAFTYDKGSFTYTGSWPADSIRWDFGDGSSATGAHADHSYAVSGKYTACVTAYACGTAGSTVCGTIDIPVSIPGVSLSSPVSVYPNPVRNILYLQQVQKGMTYVVFDITGKQYYSGVCNGTQASIDFSTYAPGAYLLRCTTQDGQRSLSKIIRE